MSDDNTDTTPSTTSLMTRASKYIRDNTPKIQTGATLAALKARAAAASLANKGRLVSGDYLTAAKKAVKQQQTRLKTVLQNTGSEAYVAPYLREGFIGSVGPWMEYCIFGLILWYVLVWMVFYPPQTEQQKGMAFMVGLVAFMTAVVSYIFHKSEQQDLKNKINFGLFCGLIILYTVLKYMNIRYNQVKVGEGTYKKTNYWKVNFGLMFAFLVGVVLSYFLIKPGNSTIFRTIGWVLIVAMVVSKIVLMAYTFKNTDKKSVYTQNLNNSDKTTIILNISEKDFYNAYQYLFLAILGVFIYSCCLLVLSYLTDNKSEGSKKDEETSE